MIFAEYHPAPTWEAVCLPGDGLMSPAPSVNMSIFPFLGI